MKLALLLVAHQVLLRGTAWHASQRIPSFQVPRYPLFTSTTQGRATLVEGDDLIHFLFGITNFVATVHTQVQAGATKIFCLQG